MSLHYILIIIFTISIFLVIWPNFGYLIFLKLLSFFRDIEVSKREYYPSVTMIIVVYNEEKIIREKLENSLSISYPPDKMQIIIASDSSSDNTEEIVRSYESKGVHLLTFPERRGKHYCQADAVNYATGEIIVFSDAATLLDDDAVRNIVSNFADESIGIVSGMDRIAGNSDESHGEGIYVRYEMTLRSLESKVGSLVGASGSFYALRKSLCTIDFPHLSSDFYLPILAYTRNYRSILDKTAIGYYGLGDDPSKEFMRKVRTVVHGIDALIQFKYILNPFKYGFYAFQMMSHKLSRWLVPFALIMAFASNLFLAFENQFFTVLFLCQIALYLFALISHLAAGFQRILPLRMAYYFVMTNLSILVAFIEFFRGQKYVTWQSTKR